MRLRLKSILIVFLLCYTAIIQGQPPVKQVKGTWINFAWQDERNKYMNPEGTDITSPDLWNLKVKELSEIGMKYLIIMYVANEGKAYYPSEFMPHAYPDGRMSPVEAIMNSADENNMKVFMSTGWAKDQDDNPALPEIRRIQLRIMHETAKLFSGHRSFYGWYLPCEDVVGPYLSQKAVDDVNILTAEAKRTTPGAQVMISPYGLRMAKFDDGKFAQQIAGLKVDIIAYQDEIGCVVEETPLPHMKENFTRLREVHNRTGIKLWANDESFTWEKGLNVRPSALIPAPLPRFLSQLTGVSKAGVDEIVSFSICGIYDKPESPIPLGEPETASKAYKEYEEWRQGKGRWPLLAASFYGDIHHDAISKHVIFNSTPSQAWSSGDLTDGKLGQETFRDTNWLGFEKKDMIATIDLGSEINIKEIAARFLSYRTMDIFLPTAVEFSVSDDGKKFRTIETVKMDQYPGDRYDCWIDIAETKSVRTSARFVRVYAINGFAKLMMADEIMINPVY
jgi:hypothetical protein